MTLPTMMVTLASLEIRPYLTATGKIDSDLEGKVGLYAIFDQNQTLQYVGYSRDVAAALKLHLVRKPDECYWVKVQTVERPSRTLLDEMRTAWLTENGAVPPGNGEQQALWEKAVDARLQMTEEERVAIANADDLTATKRLKNVARRVEAEILETLKARGVQMDLRFNPKLKEQGLLDLK